MMSNGSIGSNYTYDTTFDPTSHFDISFNPNTLEDGGAWYAFDSVSEKRGTDIGTSMAHRATRQCD